jgi:predicted HTH domain antitoxin
MENIAIPVSDALLSAINLGIEEIAAGMRREYAMKLYSEGRLTLNQSAELCGVDIYSFMSILSRASIPVIDYDARELEEELSRLQAAAV